MNISSSNVSVFPSALRTQVPNGKFIDENNFVNILNAIVDYDNDNGYVISYSNNLLKLVIHGYYFEISSFTLAASLKASIVVEDTSKCIVNTDSKSAVALDENNVFKGIYIATDAPASATGYTVYTLDITDSSSNLINTAKFSASNMRWSSSVSMEDKINSKENKLETPLGSPLSVTHGTNEANSTLTINTDTFLMKNETTSVGSTSSPVYFSSDGTPATITASSGSAAATVATDVMMAQSAVVSGGVLSQSGQRFYMSTNSPTASMGSTGDIWFKYSTGSSEA